MANFFILSCFILCFSQITIAQKAKPQSKKPIKTVSRQYMVQPKAMTDSGKVVYETYCLSCHQEDGSGVPNMNPPLTQTDWVLGDTDRLINVVLKGLKNTEINGDTYTNEMPPHDFLSDTQIADVLSYIRRSFGNKAPAISADAVKKLRDKK